MIFTGKTVINHSTCMPSYILQQSDEGRDESEDDTVSDETQRHRCYDEYTHLGLDDVAEKLDRLKKVEEIREELEPKEEVTRKIFRVV